MQLYTNAKNEMMRFSQRISKTPATKSLQLEFIDTELKNRLWNVIKGVLFNKLQKTSLGGPSLEFRDLCINLWHQFYKLPIDRIPNNDSDREAFIRVNYFAMLWYQVYDFLEFVVLVKSNRVNNDEFILVINGVLEEEFSGYRFIDGKISPISNNIEINEIETAINQAYQFTSLTVVNVHLAEALNKFSDRKNPDYRNSIKESISAVESIVKIISNNPKDSLAGALDKIKSKIKIHPALERGFKQIYGYTSDADGIRHGLMDVSDCDFEDAKFMLVSCSAFINYLIAKSVKAGISFE
jgi:hypothetical protein